HMPARVRELGEQPASIVGGCPPGNVPERLKALDEARAPAAAEQYPFGKLCPCALAGRARRRGRSAPRSATASGRVLPASRGPAGGARARAPREARAKPRVPAG